VQELDDRIAGPAHSGVNYLDAVGSERAIRLVQADLSGRGREFDDRLEPAGHEPHAGPRKGVAQHRLRNGLPGGARWEVARVLLRHTGRKGREHANGTVGFLRAKAQVFCGD
jgi:hypothetical protein